MTQPTTAGPNGDGSKSLAKESKAGIAVTFVIGAAATIALDALAKVDVSSMSGWWVPVVAGAVSAATGLITAYLKRNR